MSYKKLKKRFDKIKLENEIMKAKFLDEPIQCANFQLASMAVPTPWSNGPCTLVGACNAHCASKQQEVENTMSNERNYLNNRVAEIFYSKDAELRNKFNMDKDNQPRTYKDLIDWIKNDKFTLNTKRTAKIDAAINDGEEWYYGPFDGIKFTAVTIDADGYNAAYEALNKARQAARDVIQTQDAIAGLKALQDFEAWTYTAPAVTAVA